MTKERIAFVYASQVLPGMFVNQALFPTIWWTNIDPNKVYVVALTLGVIIDKSHHVTVTVDIFHEDSNENCITNTGYEPSQHDHFIVYPEGRQEFIGISTLNIGGVRLQKIGNYTVVVKIQFGHNVLDVKETSFFVANLIGDAHG